MSVSADIINEVRGCLRTSNNKFDDEIAALIESARSDLILCGVLPERVNSDTDALIKRAVITYAKAEFGLNNPDAEKYKQSYETLKLHLMLSTEYTVAEV